MATIRERIQIILEGKDNASDDIKRVEKNTGKLSKGVGGLASKFAGPLGLTLGIGGAVAALKSFSSELARTTLESSRFARQIGISREFLEELEFAGTQAGITQQNIRLALQRSSRRLSEFAATGKGEAVPAIEALGLAVTDAEGRMRPMSSLLPEIADGLSAIEDPGERVRIAFKLFDSEGVAFLRLLNDGSEGLAKFREEFEKYGGGVTNEYVESLERVDEVNGRLKLSFGSLISQVLGPLKLAWADVADVIAGAAGNLATFNQLAKETPPPPDPFREGGEGAPDFGLGLTVGGVLPPELRGNRTGTGPSPETQEELIARVTASKEAFVAYQESMRGFNVELAQASATADYTFANAGPLSPASLDELEASLEGMTESTVEFQFGMEKINAEAYQFKEIFRTLGQDFEANVGNVMIGVLDQVIQKMIEAKVAAGALSATTGGLLTGGLGLGLGLLGNVFSPRQGAYSEREGRENYYAQHRGGN